MKKSFLLLLSIVFLAWSCSESEQVNNPTNTPPPPTTSTEVTVNASYDSSKDLSLIMNIVKFTATWCGNCPPATLDIKRLEDENPGRVSVMAMHVSDPWTVQSIVDNWRNNEYFSVVGQPSVWANFADNMPTGGFYESLNTYFTDLSNSAEAGVALDAVVDESNSNQLNYILSFGGNANTDYRYYAFKTTNGHTASQTNYNPGLGSNPLENFAIDNVVEEILMSDATITTDDTGMFSTEVNAVGLSTQADIDTYITVVIMKGSEYINSRSFKVSGINEIHENFNYIN